MHRALLLLALASAPLLSAKTTAQVAPADAPSPAATPNGPAGAPAPAPAPPPGSPDALRQPPPAPAVRAPWLDARVRDIKDPELAEETKALETLRREKNRIEAELALDDTKRRVALAPVAEERIRLESERALRLARLAAKNADLDAEKTRLERKLAALNADYTLKSADKTARLRDLEAEGRAIRASDELATAKARDELALRKARDEADRLVKPSVAYPEDPVVDGVLRISDRRIPFNGVVTDTLADFVIARLAFYNRKDAKAPVFIVIDNSPGGSVFAELRILRAMESSAAPVYVVVKQAAASCAAITATMAKKSFCYPDTRLLHHQMSSGNRGNMTQLRENMRFTEDLYNRTFLPIVKKLGYPDSAAFEKDMYAHVSTGDWVVFGDEAVRRKWVDVLVERMVEDGVNELPEEPESLRAVIPAFAEGTEMKRDPSGRVYFQLPALAMPGDAWVLDDPDGRFHP